MDKLVMELIDLLRQILMVHEQLLTIAGSRRAMRTFNTEMLVRLGDREQQELVQMQTLELKRKDLLERMKKSLPRGFEINTSELAKRSPEPFRSQLLGLAEASIYAAEKLHA